MTSWHDSSLDQKNLKFLNCLGKRTKFLKTNIVHYFELNCDPDGNHCFDQGHRRKRFLIVVCRQQFYCTVSFIKVQDFLRRSQNLVKASTWFEIYLFYKKVWCTHSFIRSLFLPKISKQIHEAVKMSLNRRSIWGQGWYITLNPLVFGAKMGTNAVAIINLRMCHNKK